MHAKMLVTQTYCLIGSANLTVPGFYKHAENVAIQPRSLGNEYIGTVNRANDIILEAKNNPNISNVKDYINSHII